MRFLVTGHTGFKGSWLCAILAEMGHSVSGVSLTVPEDGIYVAADIPRVMSIDLAGDIRDAKTMREVLTRVSPDVVIHFAAQSLVRQGYREPLHTFETNVTGTLTLLESIQVCEVAHTLLVATSDKVYRNIGTDQVFSEDSPLGNQDPYSCSKAMADLLVQSWAPLNPSRRTVIVRAGNVVGGGDVSPERLLPDVLASLSNGRPIELRNPAAIRPWQHVLDCLAGYLRLIDKAASGGAQQGSAWNFGPSDPSPTTVAGVVALAAAYWGTANANWIEVGPQGVPEAPHLSLNSAKALEHLGWRPRLRLSEAIEWSVNWHKAFLRGEAQHETLRQIREFFAR